jgi:hypothetical protein
MMGHHMGGQERLFYSFNLEDHITDNHLLRGIDRFLDLSALRNISHRLTVTRVGRRSIRS